MVEQQMPRFDKPKAPRWVRIAIPVGVVVLVVALLAALVLPLILGDKGGGLASVKVASAAPHEGVQVAILPEQGGGDAVQGQTPWQVSLAPGSYRYVATAPGYRSANGSINVPKGEPTVTVEIPAMEPVAGKIVVRSNALIQVLVDGAVVGTAGPDPALWTSFGPFAVGPHVVSATAALGTQSQTIAVVEQNERKVEFLWGSRLQVVVEPAGILSTTVTVDGRPYTGPVDFDASRLSSRSFTQVEVAAPGYTTWADDVFLEAGNAVTANAVLQVAVVPTGTITPTTGVEEDVLTAYWRFWQVWSAAGQTFDASRLPEVMTGKYLETEQNGFTAIKSMGTMTSWTITPTLHTPTVAILTDDLADVEMSCDVTQTTVLQDGSVVVQIDQLAGTFSLQLGEDGVWRVASWSGNWVAKAEPTPVGGGGDGGGGQGSTPPDRAAIVQTLLANVNCLRADNGLPAVAYDWTMASAIQPIANAATTYAANRGWLGGLPDNQAEIESAVQSSGGFFIAESGLPISLVPANAREGLFAFDWPSYAGNPCAAGWERATADRWLRTMTHVTIVLGPAVWAGAYYETVFIAVGR